MVIRLVPAQLPFERGEAGVTVDRGQLDPGHGGEVGDDLQVEAETETGVMRSPGEEPGARHR